MSSDLRLRILPPLSLAGTLLLTIPLAHAQEPETSKVRYQRKATKTKAQADLLDTKFDQAKREVEREAKPAAEQPFAARGKGNSPELVDKQIAFLEKLIKSSDVGDPDYPDYLFRLADQHLEKKAYYELQAGALYEKIDAAKQAGKADEARKLTELQARHIREARAAGERAVNAYQALVGNPKLAGYARLDESLYYMAFELGQLGREQDMQAAYQRLIADHPSSQYISHAYLAFGDYYFENGQIGHAVRLYERVIQDPASPNYAYALYKLGWCYLNPIGDFEPRYDKSLDAFVAVIDATKAGRVGSDAAGKQLRRDARRDLVRAYVHVGKPSKAWDFFVEVGNGPGDDEHDARKMMEWLANQYFGDGQYTESTYVYTQLERLFPEDAMICDWQSKIVVNSLAHDDKKLQWAAAAELGDAYAKLSASDHAKAVKQRCRDATESTIRQLATVWHDEADKTRRAETYALAKQAYETYLARFPSGTNSYEMQYFYAELLWAMATAAWDSGDRKLREHSLALFRDAHVHFVKVLELDPKGTYTADAAYAQMLAMKNHLEYDEAAADKRTCELDSEGRCASKPGSYVASEVSAAEQQMLAAYDIYTKYVDRADDPELPKIMYHRARLMMDHNRFDEAEPLLVELIGKFDAVPDARHYAAWSAQMLLDVLTVRWLEAGDDPARVLETGEELQQWALKLQNMKLWSHADSEPLREAVPGLLAGIGWRAGKAYQEAGAAGGDPENFDKCAAKFVEVFNQFEDHDKADVLLWNAAECSDAAYRVGQAIALREALIERFPGSSLAKDTLHHLAGSYQAVAQYDDAARRYEQFAEQHAKDPRASDALQNAYLFRLGLGQQDQAQADLGQYESLYKKRDVARAATIFWSQHDLLASTAARREHASQYLDTYGNKGGLDRALVAKAVIAQIDWRRSCDEPLLFDLCVTVERKRAMSGSSASEAYQARLAAMEQSRASLERQRFKPPKRCGALTQAVVTVHRRSSKRSAAAQARFDEILALAPKVDVAKLPADDQERIEDFKAAWAMAMVYAADEAYEQYLRVDMPEQLDFVVEDWRRDSGVASWERKYAEQVEKAKDSKARVAAFLADKNRRAAELQAHYAKVVDIGSPHWILAAAARTAGVRQNFADQLYRAEVPQDFKTQEQVWAYCDELGDHADTIQAAALSAYEYCLQRSTEYQFFNEFSRLCEEELQQRDAQAYPATNELFGVSVYTASRIDDVGVIPDPLGDQRRRAK